MKAPKKLTLPQLRAFLKKAKTPEEVFDVRPDEARAAYHRFSQIAHPDHADVDDKALASETQAMLNAFWEKAERRIAAKTYGTKEPDPALAGPVQFSTRKNTYIVTDRIHSGGTAGIFRGVVTNKDGTYPVLIKAPHSACDNDLMEREANAFTLMSKKIKAVSINDGGKKLANLFALRVPAMIESLKLTEPGAKVQKTVNTFLIIKEVESGWVTLEEIRRAYPKGVDGMVMAFIFNRILEALTFAHSAKVLHCALTPNHMLIRPEDHLGQLVDWTASCQVGQNQSVPYVDEQYLRFFPKEIAEHRHPLPSSDIYMAAACMTYILGCDTLPATVQGVPVKIVEFLNRCLQPKPARRPHSADAAYQEFKTVCETSYGKKKFVNFTMPVAS